MNYFDIQAEPGTILNLNSLALAYLGDAVYELMVRSRLCLNGIPTSKKLHQAALSYVAAPAQAEAAQTIQPLFTSEEQDVFRRGKNTHTAAIPQNASREEYRIATGLEALFGWLYLNGRKDRLCQLFDRIAEELEHGGAVCH